MGLATELPYLPLVELFDRWLHFGAGVLWVGSLWSFHWLGADGRPGTRAAAWSRWAAGWSWISGVFLLFLVYYQGPHLVQGDGSAPELSTWWPAFAGVLASVVVYEVLVALGRSRDLVLLVLGSAAAVGFAALLREVWDFSMRATYVHLGAALATVMAANTWREPAARRLRHGAYLSLPVLLLMIGVTQPQLTGFDEYPLVLAVVFATGFGAARLLDALASSTPPR